MSEDLDISNRVENSGFASMMRESGVSYSYCFASHLAHGRDLNTLSTINEWRGIIASRDWK